MSIKVVHDLEPYYVVVFKVTGVLAGKRILLFESLSQSMALSHARVLANDWRDVQVHAHDRIPVDHRPDRLKAA